MRSRFGIKHCPKDWAWTGFWEGRHWYTQLIKGEDELDEHGADVSITEVDLLAGNLEVFNLEKE